MGLIDKKNHIIDFQLTNKGRELLSKNSLNFVYYAFSDDQIDYSASIDYINTPYLHFNASRVQSVATGSNNAGVLQITASLSSAPQSGSTLFAVIGTQTAAEIVNTITQTGASWTKITASLSAGGNGTNCELWWAKNIQSSAGSSVAVATSDAGQIAVIVAEYRGIISADLSASSHVDSTFATGSTGRTAQTNENFEVWIGGMSTIAGGGAPDQTSNSPGVSQVAFTGSGILTVGMYEKFVNVKNPAELIVGFVPDGTVIGTIGTFKISTSASNKENLDDYVHNNTFAFEPLRLDDKTITNFLFTMPLENDVVTQFNSSLTGSFIMKRKYEVETLENVVNDASEIDKIISQENVLDYVVVVEETQISQADRSKKYVADQFASAFLEDQRLFKK